MKNPRTLVALLSLPVLASLGLALWWKVQSAPAGDGYLNARTPTEILAEVRAEPRPRLTVLNFWASWCEPCKREFPLFLRLRREYADRGVRVMFVSVDDGSDFADAEAFLRENGVDFPTAYKGKQSLNFVADLFPRWSGAVPATIFFGPDAEVLRTWEGDVTWNDLVNRVNAQLKSP